MEIYAAIAAQRDGEPARQPAARSQALLLTETPALLGGPPPLFHMLTQRERELVLSHGRRRVLNRGQTLFNQGTCP